MKYAFMPRRQQLMVEAWRTARIAELLDEFGEDNLMAWHGVESSEELWEVLLDFSDEVLVDRFSKIDDLVSRVLGGGVANRACGPRSSTSRSARRGSRASPSGPAASSARSSRRTRAKRARACQRAP